MFDLALQYIEDGVPISKYNVNNVLQLAIKCSADENVIKAITSKLEIPVNYDCFRAAIDIEDYDSLALLTLVKNIETQHNFAGDIMDYVILKNDIKAAEIILKNLNYEHKLLKTFVYKALQIGDINMIKTLAWHDAGGVFIDCIKDFDYSGDNTVLEGFLLAAKSPILENLKEIQRLLYFHLEKGKGVIVHDSIGKELAEDSADIAIYNEYKDNLDYLVNLLSEPTDLCKKNIMEALSQDPILRELFLQVQNKGL